MSSSSSVFNNALKTELVQEFNSDEMIATFAPDGCVELIEQILTSSLTAPKFTVLRINTLAVSSSIALQTIMNILKDCNAFLHPQLPDVIVLNPSRDIDTRKLPKVAEVIVDVKCGLAIMRGSHLYVPGVLSAPHEMRAGDEIAVYADLERKCLRGSTSHFNGRKTFVGNGTAKISRQDLFIDQIKNGVAVEMTDPISPCPSLIDMPDDMFFPQNLPSIVCSHVVGAKQGERILDMCAAPGGKCTHLAGMMDNLGVIVALDKTVSKIERIKWNCSKLRVKCVHPFAFDATKAWDPSSTTNTDWTDKVSPPPYSSETFDRVLLDAPCSALGQRPQLINNMSVKELNSFPKLQRNLIANAVRLVKDGGVLVYSTCTFTLKENEDIVQWTLKKFPWMELVDQEPFLGENGLPCHGLTLKETNLLQRFGVYKKDQNKPAHDVDTIGFFIAKFVKKLTNQ